MNDFEDQRSYQNTYPNYQEDSNGVTDQLQNKPGKGLLDKSRIGFIRKVYLILSAQLLLSVLMTVAAMYSESFSNFQTENTWLMITAIVIIFVVEIAIFCFQKVARTVPTNYICLSIFTIGMAYVVSAICSQVKNNDSNGAQAVLVAAIMTLGIVVALTLYAFHTKTDFTIMGGFLFCFGMIFVIFGIFLAFQYSRTAYIIYSAFGCLLYSLYLIYDTQLIAGKRRYELSIDDYVIGALFLYIDIIGLFLQLLRLLGSK